MVMSFWRSMASIRNTTTVLCSVPRTQNSGKIPLVISANSLHKASKVIGGSTKEQLDRTFARFFQAQPLVLEFIVRLSGHRDRIHDMVMQLSVFVFKAYEAEYPGKTGTLKREDFLPGYDRAKSWAAEFINGATHDSVVKTEPFLLTYFVETLGKPLEDGTEYSTQEEHDIILIINILDKTNLLDI